MAVRCRTCEAPLDSAEVNSSGGGGISLRASPAFDALMDEEGFDGTSAAWISRYLDGHACAACGTVVLTLAASKLYLDCESPRPHSDRPCRSCEAICLGPLSLESDATGDSPLAALGPRYGAPLWADLCPQCERVWLRLHPEDDEAREQLAARFPDGGPCDRCEKGRLRVTGVDVPHSGVAGLYRPQPPEDGRHRGPEHVADLRVAVCDHCGEAAVRL